MYNFLKIAKGAFFLNRFFKMLIGFGLFIMCCGALKAQDIKSETLVWTATKVMDDADSTITDYSCTFTTHGITSIDWNQNAGARLYSYSVTGVEGSWTNVLADGQATYQIESPKVKGTLVFSRQNGQAQAHLITSVNGQITLDYIFYFDTVRTAQ